MSSPAEDEDAVISTGVPAGVWRSALLTRLPVNAARVRQAGRQAGKGTSPGSTGITGRIIISPTPRPLSCRNSP